MCVVLINHSSHANHSNYAAHSNHGSHSNHTSHSSTSFHNSHTNSVTNIDKCTTVGTTFTKLPNPKTAVSTWNDLKAKINEVRTSWGLANTTASPAAGAKVVASDWNTYVKDKLTQAPIPAYNATNFPNVVNPLTATANSSKLSTVSYDHGVNSAQSKKCVSVCLSVCEPYTNTHSNHASHSAHSNHGSHSNHTSHGSHSSHSSHAVHTFHDSHNAHAEHSNHASHSEHSFHWDHGSSMCDAI